MAQTTFLWEKTGFVLIKYLECLKKLKAYNIPFDIKIKDKNERTDKWISQSLLNYP